MEGTNLTRAQKAAVVIVSLGSENASNIYKFLHEDEIEQITFEIARLRNLSPEETEFVLNEFYQLCVTQKEKDNINLKMKLFYPQEFHKMFIFRA